MSNRMPFAPIAATFRADRSRRTGCATLLRAASRLIMGKVSVLLTNPLIRDTDDFAMVCSGERLLSLSIS